MLANRLCPLIVFNVHLIKWLHDYANCPALQYTTFFIMCEIVFLQAGFCCGEGVFCIGFSSFPGGWVVFGLSWLVSPEFQLIYASVRLVSLRNRFIYTSSWLVPQNRLVYAQVWLVSLRIRPVYARVRLVSPEFRLIYAPNRLIPPIFPNLKSRALTKNRKNSYLP